jgi:hypothetical protein
VPRSSRRTFTRAESRRDACRDRSVPRKYSKRDRNVHATSGLKHGGCVGPWRILRRVQRLCVLTERRSCGRLVSWKESPRDLFLDSQPPTSRLGETRRRTNNEHKIFVLLYSIILWHIVYHKRARRKIVDMFYHRIKDHTEAKANIALPSVTPFLVQSLCRPHRQFTSRYHCSHITTASSSLLTTSQISSTKWLTLQRSQNGTP